MTVNFYDFSKRVNSTKQPTGAVLASPDCKLKANCSEHDPVLILATNSFSYNYAYISDWGKYYFVKDVVSLANGLVEYYLTEDVLATYKTAIGNTTAHVAYSSYTYNDYMIDPRLQVSTKKEQYWTTATTSTLGLVNVFELTTGYGQGGYIMSVFTDNAGYSSCGFATSYLLSQAGMDKARSWFGDVHQHLQQYLNGTQLSAVMGCIWVPYDIETGYLTSKSYMQIADRISSSESVTFNAGELYTIDDFPTSIRDFEVDLHLAHADNLSHDFRDCEPYTTGTIFLPGVGSIDLCMGDWMYQSKIKVRVLIELVTGNIMYLLKDSNDHIVQTATCNVSAQCPLGQMTMNSSGVMQGIGATIGGAVSLAGSIAATVASHGATAPMVAASAASLIGGAASTALSYNQHAASVTGGTGSRLSKWCPSIRHNESVCTTESINATYNGVRGAPADYTGLLSGIPGFIQCEGASVSCNGNIQEKIEINNFLNSGFYYE